MDIEKYRKTFENYLRSFRIPKTPANLYEPARYILSSGGKRLRPTLTLIATEGYGKPLLDALPAATALEIFHNFTLLHDDIMDHASLRRGQPTVHKKWNENIAILSGDVMIFMAQQLLEVYSDRQYKSLQTLLNHTAIQVCEGQQLDMDFENRIEVSAEEYLEMIKKKTAVLLGTSLQYGAIIAEKNPKEQKVLYEAGIHLGIAFQIADDYLDTFGDSKFGKETGGDIREGKKTYLYIKALDKMKIPDRKEFVELYTKKEKTSGDINEIIDLLRENNIPLQAKKIITDKTRSFIHLINSSGLDTFHKRLLIHLAEQLSERTI